MIKEKMKNFRLGNYQFEYLTRDELPGYILISRQHPQSEIVFFFEGGALISSETSQLFGERLQALR